MSNIVKTLRNHWKKSVFGALVCSYGVHYLNNKHNDNEMHRNYCEMARKYGNQKIKAISSPRKVTVLLNPSAGNGYSRDQFYKIAEPLLHLAGLEVTIVETQKEGQARDIVEVMDKTDALIVAGGDGTVLEAVTGLMRSGKYRTLPLGIIPLGEHNTVAKSFYNYTSNKHAVRWLGDACIAAIEGITQSVDVMVLQGPSGKPVYSIGYLDWGPLRDAWVNRTRFWYLGPLKHRLCYIISALKEWPNDVSADVHYIEPCPSGRPGGCVRCKDAVTLPPAPPDAAGLTNDGQLLAGEGVKPAPGGGRWVQRLVGPSRTTTPAKTGSKGASERELESLPDFAECGTERQMTVDSHDLQLIAPTTVLKKENAESAVLLTSCPRLESKLAFIQEGWNRLSDSPDVHRNTLQTKCRQVKLIPAQREGDKKQRWMSVDNEMYEVGNLDVSVIPKILQIFTNNPTSS